MNFRLLLSTAAVAVLPLASASAAVVFFPNNPAGFNAAIAGRPLLGTENWEQSNLAAGNLMFLNDPLSPGVANGPFTTGTGTGAGVTAQSNTGGANSSALSPLGVAGLATASAGFAGTPSDQLSPNNWNQSFDLIFNAVGGPAGAVSLIGLYFDAAASSSTSTPGSLLISVYDLSNVLLGTQTLTGVDYSQTDYIGIQATGTSRIGRINLYASTNSANSTAGADDISVYSAVPEPSSAAYFGLLLLSSLRRRRS